MAKEIKVALTLDTKDFNKKITRAKGQMSSFGGASKVTTGSIIGLAARLAPLAAIIAGVGTAFSGLKRSLDVASEIEDVGVTLGNIVGTAEGGAAALNKIKDIAKELPVSFQELAASAPALSTVSGTIGELEDNIRLAADIAGNFGIPFEVAAGQLQRAFSAGSGAADVFREKGVLAAAGFEAGVTLSIDETIAKLREFGTEIEGSAEKLAKTFSGAVNQAGDAVFDFQSEIGNAIKPELTVFIQTLTERFRENEEEVRELAKQIGTSVVNGFIKLGRAVALLIDFTRKLVAPIINLNEGLKAVGTNLPIVATAIYVVVKAQKAFRTATLAAANAFIFLQGVTGVGLLKVGAGIAAATATTALLTVAVNEAAEAFDNTTGDTEGATGAFNEFADAILTGGEEVRSELENVGDAAKELGDDLKIALGTGADDFEAFIDSFNNSTDKLVNGINKILGANDSAVRFSKTYLDILKELDEAQLAVVQKQNAFFAIGEAFKETLPSLTEVNQLVSFLQDNYEELGLTLAELPALIAKINDEFEGQEGLRNFITTLESANKALGKDLATAFLEGENAGDSFKKFFKTLVTQIIADVIRLSIIQPILGAIMSPFGFGFGAGGNIIKLPGKADGGPVASGSAYVVGERGPELFVPSSSGSIVPNHALGMGQQVTYNINAVDAASFKTLVARDPEFIYNVTRAGSRRVPG